MCKTRDGESDEEILHNFLKSVLKIVELKLTHEIFYILPKNPKAENVGTFSMSLKILRSASLESELKLL